MQSKLHNTAYTTQDTERRHNMNELTVIDRGEVVAQNSFTTELFSRWTSFIDAKPKTIETYTKALRQLFSYFSLNGIRQPQREDIIAFREELTQWKH